MDSAPPSFVPKAGSKKRKKKKKKKRSAPKDEVDPHYDPDSVEAPTESKRRPKSPRSRRTHFEVDATATAMLSQSGSRFKDKRGGGMLDRGVKNRIPKGTRTQLESLREGTYDTDNIQNLEQHDKQFTDKLYAPKVFDDDDSHGDEDEHKSQGASTKQELDDDNDVLMDMDASKLKKEEAGKHNGVDEEEDDGWHIESVWSNEDYAPIELKQKPSFGALNKQDMSAVFRENEEKNEFVFFQMPAVLPLVSHLSEDEKFAIKQRKKVQTSLLKQFGEGEIGKIRIRKSGKAEFVVGDYVLDVDFASPMDCYQQVMHLRLEMATDEARTCPYKGKAQFVGSVPPQNNLVCSYRVKDLVV
eukprot:CAMPEP_0197025822 /NCGR_PEP_ID=MMETSP1384-20130603/6038_1 /TAXON_ID=29189 /ORGANISM="Ammonia sp." /LENGTH=356 /DNA_ID=CAMNT_0042454397 /DNA_START=26 /DNA_END=1096 /DNA_ORIENTATION=-